MKKILSLFLVLSACGVKSPPLAPEGRDLLNEEEPIVAFSPVPSPAPEPAPSPSPVAKKKSKKKSQ